MRKMVMGIPALPILPLAGAQMMPQLAFHLINRVNNRRIKEILENDIVLLWPTMNPDGQQNEPIGVDVNLSASVRETAIRHS